MKHSHHKIGVIIFALVFFQFLVGIGIAIYHRLQSQPRKYRSHVEYVSLTSMFMSTVFADLAICSYLHMLFGRIVLLLGWAQLWDGVFFFGSPLVVYILLGIAQGLILVAYLGMSSELNLFLHQLI